MAMFGVEFDGLEKFISELSNFTDRIELAVASALFVEGEQTMAESKPLVPVDEGVLRSSGFVMLPQKENGDIFVDVGYGGPAGSGNIGAETNTKDVGYAIIQHEDLTFFHVVGQAKFLEVVVNKRKQGYSRRIARRIDAKLK